MKKSLILMGCLICACSFTTEAQLIGYNYTKLHSFSNDFLTGAFPFTGVIREGNTLYGNTTWIIFGTNSPGSIFSLKTDGSDFAVIYNYDNPAVYGYQSMAGLLFYDGRLFCSGYEGGLFDQGTLFSILPDGNDIQLLHTFGEITNDGLQPNTTLIEDNSMLYGTTEYGGVDDNGTVFSLAPDGSDYTILHQFADGTTDGQFPSMGQLAIDNLRIYGTTTEGGLYDCGVLYSMTKAGNDYQILHHFNATNAGGFPMFAPIADRSTLYGTCTYGYYYEGTLYAVKKDGSDYKTLHTFGMELDNGAMPYNTLLDDGTHLYGTTAYGGPNYLGTVFALHKQSLDFTILHGFGETTGAYPIGGQLQLYNGTLYGTTLFNDWFSGVGRAPFPFSGGNVFSLDISGGITPSANNYVETTRERVSALGPQSTVEIDITGDYPTIPPRYLIASFDPPAHGTAAYNAETGVFTYIPDRNFRGIDTFSFYTFDGSEGSITIYVKPVAKRGDFDGDGAADPAVFWPIMGEWFIDQSESGLYRHEKYGWDGTVPVAADYDGDGIIDVAVYSPVLNQWFAQFSGSMSSINGIVWGNDPEDIPVPADYDGDGKADLAVYKPSTGEWTIRRSTTMMPWTLTLGGPGQNPVPADYTGDGIAQPAVYNGAAGQWSIFDAPPMPIRTVAWGWMDAVPVPADYDGDGLTDIAVFWPTYGTWYIQLSHNRETRIQNWGWASTPPVAADYDNDGIDDIAVYHADSGTWYIQNSSNGEISAITWGWSEAIPAFH